MSQLSTGFSHQEKQSNVTPLVVTPREASHMLAVCLSTVYNLMRTGELQNYRDGSRMRRIPTESIHNYIARRVAAGGNAGDGAMRRRVRGRAPPN
jgi:excisionase family DNA binding protein